VYTGVLAGEKLHEVLWNDDEAVGPTSHPKIMRAAHVPIDQEWLEAELAELERLVDEGDTLGVVGRLGAIVREPVRTGAEAVLEDTMH
jgi:FlaA1/EpsC-like NDP-sugar epimerase